MLALRDGGKMPEASVLAQKYAALGPLNQKLMMEVMVASLGEPSAVPLTPAQQSLLTDAIDAQKSADAAQSYGWSRFKADDIAGAETWFRKSAGWQPSEPAAIGLMLVARRLKQPQDYAATVAQYRATYPRVAELDAVMRTPARRAEKRAATRSGARHADVRVAARGDGWDKSATAIVETFENGKVDEALAMMGPAQGPARRTEGSHRRPWLGALQEGRLGPGPAGLHRPRQAGHDGRGRRRPPPDPARLTPTRVIGRCGNPLPPLRGQAYVYRPVAGRLRTGPRMSLAAPRNGERATTPPDPAARSLPALVADDPERACRLLTD